MPVIIHSRAAIADALAAVEERQLKAGGVLHAFAGESSDVERAVAAGLLLSFAGPLTYRRADTLAGGCRHSAGRAAPSRDGLSVLAAAAVAGPA